MSKATSLAVIAAVLMAGAIAPVASAQTQTYATMPTFYSASGQPVNVGNTTALPAGYYYLSPGGQQVYYYGNGTYYNPATGMYGGSVNNSLGTAGYNLGYTTTYADPNNLYQGSGGATGSSASYPGVPNTGLGGEALATWITLVLSLGVVIAGVSYLVATRRHA